MAFDKESAGLPLVQTKKRTTQVNIGMAFAVVLFFAVVGVVLWTILRNPEETGNAVNQAIQQGK